MSKPKDPKQELLRLIRRYANARSAASHIEAADLDTPYHAKAERAYQNAARKLMAKVDELFARLEMRR